jgi:hypothetical protein
MQSTRKATRGDTMKSGTRHEAEGKLHEVKGKIKEIAGKIIADPDLEAEDECKAWALARRRPAGSR